MSNDQIYAKLPLLISLILALTISTAFGQNKPEFDINSTASRKGTTVYKPEIDSIRASYTFPKWFIDGKFGIFIHWGVYSLPAFGSEWYARNMYMQGSERKVIFQGVHQLMGSDLGPAWAAGEERVSKMVFIGIDLPKDIFLQGMEQCLV